MTRLMPVARTSGFVAANLLIAMLAIGARAAPALVEGDDRPETIEERVACTPDVLKLCKAAIPNRRAILTCLASNGGGLSSGCHDVMARRGWLAGAQASPASGIRR